MASIELILDQEPFIAGHSVRGSVLLNFRLLQGDGTETVYVKLTGRMHGKLSSGQSSIIRNFDLVNHQMPIWKRGQAYPSPGSDVLTLPFDVPLRVDLPPSFTARIRNLQLSIKYTLHVVGERPGLFKIDTDIKKSMTIQPNDTVSESVQTRLRGGWDGPWTPIQVSERMSKYIVWGELADVDVRVSVSPACF